MTKAVTTNNATRAFNRGLRELKVKDAPEVRKGIFRILGVKSKQAFQYYASGKAVSLDVLKAQQIEALFAAYGVKECWGE